MFPLAPFIAICLCVASPGWAQSVMGDESVSSADETLWSMTMVDGTALVGRIASEREGRIEFVLVDGTLRTILRKDVSAQDLYQPMVSGRQSKDLKDIWRSNPNRTRHLWSPSAMPLKKGEGYISQREIIFTAGAYGLTDNLTLLVGSMLPALLAGPDGFNLVGALKLATNITQETYLATGFESMLLPSLGAIGVGFGSVTYGHADRQITLTGGKPFIIASDEQTAGDLMIGISGMYRVSERFAVVSENIIVPGVSMDNGWANVLTIHGLVVRRNGENTAWDFGFVTVGGAPFALPWFDWTWHFEP